MSLVKVRNVKIQKNLDLKELVFILHSLFQLIGKGQIKMRFKFFEDQLVLVRKLEHRQRMIILKFFTQTF